MTHKEKDLSFEEAFMQLETIAERLESGEITLEESINAYEQAMRLIRFCNEKLDAAELRLQKLIKDENGDFQLELMQ